MGKLLKLCFVIFALWNTPVHAQERAEVIGGSWLTASGDVRITVFQTGDQYYGSISWLREPSENGKPKTDKENPDVKLRNRPLLGLLLLRGFKYEGNNVWTNGKIYDPKSGKDYSCRITLAGKDKLEVRGYIGISLLGRTETWTRVQQ